MEGPHRHDAGYFVGRLRLLLRRLVQPEPPDDQCDNCYTQQVDDEHGKALGFPRFKQA